MESTAKKNVRTINGERIVWKNVVVTTEQRVIIWTDFVIANPVSKASIASLNVKMVRTDGVAKRSVCVKTMPTVTGLLGYSLSLTCIDILERMICIFVY